MSQPLPTGALASHIAILGKTGSGKTYAAKGIVESILADGGRVCIVDPTGAWHGLRSSATGKSAGFPVVIFGGSHADLPLGGAHGEAIAEIIGTASDPAILDTSLMRVGERTKFFADFADALVRKNKGPLHLVIDEAHLFAPQGKVGDPQAGAMLHAANNLVSLGRSRGLRIILISQRPAKLHKDSLTQVETLVAMRLIAPQDRAAVEAWIKDNADEKQGREIIQSLATLKTGQGWVWAPELRILERVTFPKIKTLDTSQAPGDDGSHAEVVLARIDKDAIQKRLEVVAADAVANDPSRLKSEISTLKRELAAKSAPGPDPVTVQDAERRGYGSGYARGKIDGYGDAVRGVEAELGAVVGAIDNLGASIQSVRSAAAQLKNWVEKAAQNPPKVSAVPQSTPRPVVAPRSPPSTPAGESMSPTTRKILDVIHAANPMALSFEAASLRAGVSRRSSALRLYRQQVEASGEVERRGDGKLVSAPGFAAPLPVGVNPIETFAARLPPSYAGMLRAIAASLTPLSKEQIAYIAGVSVTSSGLTGGLRELMALSLIEKAGDGYVIHRDLAA